MRGMARRGGAGQARTATRAKPPLRAMSPPTGKIGADLDMMGMSSPTPAEMEDEEAA